MISPLKYLDYKVFLKSIVDQRGEKRGFQGQLAAAAGCQPAYLSQVLRSHVHITPEHACNLALFLGLDEWETDYFLLLVDYGRAGSRRLRQRLKNQLEKVKREAEHFGQRLKEPGLNTAETQALYYSSWHWGAIHMLVSVPETQTAAAISHRLNLPLEMVLETLRGLKTMGLIKQENDRWSFAGGNLHVPKESPLNGVNHQNWRTRAVQDSQNLGTDGIHYTSSFTVTRDDFEKLKSMLLAFIDEQRQIVARSDCEELVCFTCDLFKP